MIDRNHRLPVKRQAELLDISPGSADYRSRSVSLADLELMRRIDQIHLQHPTAGSRMLRDILRREGFAAGRCHIGTLMAITLEACHAVDALEQAFARYGTPEIVNTDQCSQFTADDFCKAVQKRGCALSMDGRGAWRDNVFIERFWRTIQYDEIYLKAYDSVAAARQGIDRIMQWYNTGRPHSSVDKRPPIEAYYALLPALKTAA